ncbi:MAG TPA: cyanophycinase [Burkholderiaceae bacterium]|nr:cyanophycinase [Burkholderiaceae bacterium]
MSQDATGESRPGHLVIIGGAEDRTDDKLVLGRFVELLGLSDPAIVLVTAGNGDPEHAWEAYDRAFGDLGVKRRQMIDLCSREAANDGAAVRQVLEADGIFMTGSDQKRLVAALGGSAVAEAMRRAFRERGVCLGGTSAGASALSDYMLVPGLDDGATQDSPPLAAGLGFVQRVVIDQHFSERKRLGRLLTVVAHNPSLLGIGIDEDTALIVEPGGGIEVVGDGAVTLIDGRQMSSNFLSSQGRQRLELIDVKLHLLPPGARYRCEDQMPTRKSRRAPDPLRDIVSILTSQGAHLS